MRTAAQMKASLQACWDAGDHNEALEMATDLTLEADGMRRELVGELLGLAADLDAEATRLAKDGRINELGVVQHRGSHIDRLCGMYTRLTTWAGRAQRAAGLDPNA